MSKLTRGKAFLGAIIAIAVSAGVLTVPAKAADQVTLTIWTFGEVIQACSASTKSCTLK